jgi:hypothetical protein
MPLVMRICSPGVIETYLDIQVAANKKFEIVVRASGIYFVDSTNAADMDPQDLG